MIYLLHADKSVGTVGRNSAQHYIGYAKEDGLWRRLMEHQNNTSRAKIITAFHEVGAKLYLVRLWPEGGQALERHLKETGHYKSRCPVCTGILPLEQAVSLEVVQHLLMTPSASPSLKLTPTGRRTLSRGTITAKPGVSLQAMLQTPATLLESGRVPSRPNPGSYVYGVAAPTKIRGASSAGTKLPSFAAGKHGGYRTTAFPKPTQMALPTGDDPTGDSTAT